MGLMMGQTYNGEAMAEAIADWVRIESPTHDVGGVNAMLDLIDRQAPSALARERLAGREGLGDVLIFRAGPQNGQKPLLLLSHVDTVHPVGTLAKDLPLRRDGDRLYGPGIYDMKGGAYLAFAAFQTVALAQSSKRPLVFIFTPDEEIGSPTTRALIEAEGRKAEAVLVTEPARDGGKIVTARKGVGRFDVTVEGRPAHSGTSHAKGRSAIREAAHQILTVEGMTDYARGITTAVGMVSGGTAANTIPQWAQFCVDLRVTNVADGQHFSDAILGLKPHDPDLRVTVTGGMNRPPYEKNAGVIGLFEKVGALARELGLDLQDVPMTGGGSDGNFTAALGIPTLDGLGIDGDGAHTLQEYGLVSSIAPRAGLLHRILERL
jgi:glutamate carboxypeptidase